MARVLDAEAIGAYRDDGFICPITMMSPEEARHCRDQLESFEEEHGRVFSESREHAGESLTGSYRFKSHLLMKWLADMVHHPRILDVVEDLIGPGLPGERVARTVSVKCRQWLCPCVAGESHGNQHDPY